MALSEFETKRVERLAGEFVEGRRPRPEIRDQVDLSFWIEGQSVVIFEIRPRWNDPGKKIESMVAKATFVRSKGNWKVFWQRADGKWHRYDPVAEVDDIEGFFRAVGEDQHACFFG